MHKCPRCGASSSAASGLCVACSGVIISMAPGAVFQQTMSLRWNKTNGLLEQMWQGSDGTQEWKPIPTVEPK